MINSGVISVRMGILPEIKSPSRILQRAGKRRQIRQ
jgi:hypothetical protein